MREIAKSGRTFFEIFLKNSLSCLFSVSYKAKNYTATEQNSFFRGPHAVEAALIVHDLDEVDSKKLHGNN